MYNTICSIKMLAIFFLLPYFESIESRAVLAGNSLLLCNPKNPCPVGSSCMYNRLSQGTKSCFRNVQNILKHAGRCPRVLTYGDRLCDFDSDCFISQKCCGVGHRVCVTAELVPPQPSVTQIIVGSVASNLQANPATFDFLGSVALAQSNGFNVLFDTAGYQDKIQLLANLRDIAGLYPEDIDYIVTSHGHPDHTGNVNLFPDVTNNYNGFRVTGNRYTANALFANTGQREFINGDQSLEIIQTPGHTLSDTSLIVRNVPGQGTVIISGDVFQTPNDYNQPQQGENDTLLAESRTRLACLADYIVPGHGPMFQVTTTIKRNFNCINL